MQNYCFLLLNKKICDVVVTVVSVKSAKTWKKARIYVTNEHLSLIGASEIKGEIMNQALHRQFIVCQIYFQYYSRRSFTNGRRSLLQIVCLSVGGGQVYLSMIISW